MKNFLALILIIFIFNSCFIRNPGANINVEGLRPVYITPDIDSIQNKAPEQFSDLGNIVIYNSYIYIVDNYKGVHIIENSDPSNPETISFICIPGVTQISIDEDILFANFWKDLILIDISSPLEIRLFDTIEDFYPLETQNSPPPEYFGSFECPDLTKGIISAWVEAELFDPQCWR